MNYDMHSFRLPFPCSYGMRRPPVGPESRPAVVLLHSSASSSRQWDVLVERLRPNYRVHAIDLHGHGRQAPWREDRPLSLQDEAELALDAVERSGGAHLIGHSYGAAVAVHLAAERPALVRSLAVFEPVLFALLADRDPHCAGTREAVAVGTTIGQLVASGQAAEAAERFVDYWSGPRAWRRLPAYVQQAIVLRMPAVVQNFQALYDATLPGEHLLRLRMPMLCLTGANSTTAALRLARMLRVLLPGARHELLEGVGHMGPITHPTLVNERLVRFLDSVAGERRMAAAGAELVTP
jgi:pimeloyl-ACP methyl ester carboxylesterase